MATVRTNSVFERMERAEALKTSGAYDLFRGQPRDWRPLQTSLARKTAMEREQALEQISRFVAWATYDHFERIYDFDRCADGEDGAA